MQEFATGFAASKPLRLDANARGVLPSATMKQLLCRDLKAGDVLLRMATQLFHHKVIQFGQRLAGQPNAFLAHSAIALDPQFVVEAREFGITVNHLAMEKNKGCGYYVFRCTNSALAQGAATTARMFLDIVHAGGKMKYDGIGAARSIFGHAGNPKTAAEMDALLDALLKGRNHAFFCSQFVAYVYQFAAYQSGLPAKTIFNISDAKVTSSVLASLMLRSPDFREAGYLMPNER
jgi:hypothetical protein